MKIKQFDIWLANLNPRMGSEAGKIRPVIVVQTDLLNKTHLSTLICPITTNIIPEAAILRVHLKQAKFGLHADSDILIDQIRAIDNNRFLEKIGEVDGKTATRIKENLKIVLDLE